MPTPLYYFKNLLFIPDILKNDLESRLLDFENSSKNNCFDFSVYSDFEKELKSAFIMSGFIARSLVKDPSIITSLLETGDLARVYRPFEISSKVRTIKESSESIENFSLKIRQLRLREMVRIAWRDINGLSDLDETMEDLSCLAESCVDEILDFIHCKLAEKTGFPKKSDGSDQRLVVLGMGKLGARELNFSSDIDLVFAYPENTQVNEDITSEEFFTKVARLFMKFFSESTSEGLLFRVDMRLRPYGDSGPVVMNFAAMEDYYQTQGREWERYALIKARIISGNKEDGDNLMQKLRPFVYRRYFDYSTFDAIRDLKKSISGEINRKQLYGNIKLGAGGIREIEFFGQIFQLLRGGVEIWLQERSILKILEMLHLREYIPFSAWEDLRSAYYFLRNLEHRLQEAEDLQTHDLPLSEREKIRLAFGMGFEDIEDFEKNLQEHQKKVHSHFNFLLRNEDDENQDAGKASKIFEPVWIFSDDDISSSILKKAGFENPADALKNIVFIKDLALKQAGQKGKMKLDRLMPTMLEKISESPFPDTALSRISELFKAIMQRTCYIALLEENIVSVENLIKLACSSPWIMNFLSRHPVLLDELLDPRTLYAPPTKVELKDDLEYRLSQINDENIELQMEIICIFKQSRLLRVAAADITASYPLMRVSDHLTEIAETILEQVTKLSFIQLVKRYAGFENHAVENPVINSFVVIAYGKLGGIELGYGSDLDLVFFHHGYGDYSKGFEGIESTYFFTRLAQRIIHFLTTHSNAGTIYETDTRLRPSGNSGMLVSHIDSFEDYILNTAWTWEHQAIVRARVILGGKDISQKFSSIRKKVLCTERNILKLKSEIAEMSFRIRSHNRKKPVSGFHLKYDEGGIVDLEFFVQYLVLAYSSSHPEMALWTDNVRILETAAKTGIIPEKTALELKSIYLLYRSEVHKRDLLGQKHETEEKEFGYQRDFVIKIWKNYIL